MPPGFDLALVATRLRLAHGGSSVRRERFRPRSRLSPDVGRKASEIATQHIQLPLDERLMSLAVRQHAVVSLDQLRQLGLSASGVRDRVEATRLHTVHRAVYSLVPLPLLGRDGRFMAAVLACGPGAAISHRCAAALTELRRTDRANIDVTIPQRSRASTPASRSTARSR